MLKRCFALCVVLMMASAANAGIVVGLTPDVAGPYNGGEVLNVGIDIWSDGVADAGPDPALIRTMQLDFSQSDGALGVSNFAWESLISASPVFGSFVDLPVPGFSYTGTVAFAAFMFNVPLSGTPVRVGSVAVTLPSTPGDFTLDALTAADPTDTNLGGLVSSGFGVDSADPIIDRRQGDGLDGGSLVLSVVPEPATLVFLGLGGIAALRRRKKK